MRNRGPTLAVVIPSKNRPAELAGLLASVGRQSSLPAEVVVVDQSASPYPAEVWQGISELAIERIHAWRPELRGLPQARNVGIDLSRGDPLAFLDDDMELDTDYFRWLLDALGDHPEAGGVCGWILQPDEPAPSKLATLLFRSIHVGPFRRQREELYRSRPDTRTPVTDLPGASMYRRLVFQEERFDEALEGYAPGEDFDFSYRVRQRHSLYLEPRACALHFRATEMRVSSYHAHRDTVVFYRYFFTKNLKGSLLEWTAFLWLNLGLFMRALWRRRREEIRGIIAGWAAAAPPGSVSLGAAESMARRAPDR